jgi:riboflavin kinase/FMN adenylyltransferase
MVIEQELATSAPQRETLLTIGVFDGVHTGHRYLLENLKIRAREKNLLTGVVTFNPHPQSVLHPNSQLPCLSDLKNRVKSLQELGIDLVAVLSFTPEVSQLNAQAFISLLQKYLKMRGLVVGPDFALGKGREGNAKLLHSLGQEMGFSVETIPPFTINGEIVSSTLIRQVLAQGNMTKTGKLMGHHFYLAGKVITASKRGRTLGFPTANLNIRPQQALPSNGVYATITQVDGKQFVSATNIGTRPSFGESEKTVETHLLNYEGSLYGKEIKVEFIQKLRDEQRFGSSEELKAQIRKDTLEAAAIYHSREKHEILRWEQERLHIRVI